MSTFDMISDYVNDHYEHFGAYPAEVEVDGVVYTWNEYWRLIDDEQSTAGRA
jgi:hypothetical protein